MKWRRDWRDVVCEKNVRKMSQIEKTTNCEVLKSASVTDHISKVKEKHDIYRVYHRKGTVQERY